MIGNTILTADEPVYKVITNENWSVIIPVEQVMADLLLAEEYVKIKFLKNQYESWAEVKVLNNADGNTYLELIFNNSMITFSTDRFIDIEIIFNEEKGLKIPNSSIVKKEFFLIPAAYVTKGGDNDKNGVIKESYQEDGAIYSEFIETDIYSYDEENNEYYIDIDVLHLGDNLILPNSQDKFTVSRRGTLIGVYNINKGFADFRQINILYQNDEYAIVKSNTTYGLNVYDYIVLDASAVKDDQFIYD